jgi:hypothetical protein
LRCGLTESKRIQIELNKLNEKISFDKFENNLIRFKGFENNLIRFKRFENNLKKFSDWPNSRFNEILKKSFFEVLFSNRDNLVNTTNIGIRIGDAE